MRRTSTTLFRSRRGSPARRPDRLKCGRCGCSNSSHQSPVSSHQSPVSNHQSPMNARERVDEIYRTDSRRVLATLIRLLGDFDLAEEALHDAFMAALERWPNDGVPANPRAWLVSTGRFKAIDRVRRRASFDAAVLRFG